MATIYGVERNEMSRPPFPQMACVLIVEDEVVVLMRAQSVLEQADHAISTAHTVAEAQTIICSSQTIDLVFTDLKLGDQADGGTMVGELLNRERPGTPVLYTSGQLAGCTPFLPKPYTAQALTKAVDDLVRGSSVGPDPI